MECCSWASTCRLCRSPLSATLEGPWRADHTESETASLNQVRKPDERDGDQEIKPNPPVDLGSVMSCMMILAGERPSAAGVF